MNRRTSGSMPRRRFLECVGFGTLGLGAASLGASGAQQALQAAPRGQTPRYPGRVVEVAGADVLADGEVRGDVVDRMLERGLLELTGAATLADAWRLFVAPDDVVGLKVNTLSGPYCSTHRELVEAIVRGLTLAGVPTSQVLVWDRFESHLRRTRYAIRQRPGDIRCYATDSPGVGSDLDVYYEADVLDWIPEHLRKDPARGFAAVYPNSHFSAIFTRHLTKQINLPVLKDHNITGVTLGLKNLAFGICGNTERFHPTPINGDPMIAEVCAHPMVQAKNVLTIADCITVIYEGGPLVDPKHLLHHRSLLVGTDLVAMDSIGLDILEKVRDEKGLPSLWKTNSPPKYISSAARLGLGIDALESIDHRKLVVPAP